MIIKDLLTGFLDAYLVRQDLEGAASFLSVQFVGLGMDAYEAALNREQFCSRMNEEFQNASGGFCYEICDYHETCYRTDLCGAYCRISVSSVDGKKGKAYQGRVTVTASNENGEWKLLQMHMSELFDCCGERAVFPIRYGCHAEQKIDAAGSKKLTEMLFSMLPGGILGVYLEDGFPLYFINDTMLNYLGYEYEELEEATGKKMKWMVAPEDWERVQKTICDGIRRNGEYDIQYRIVCKDGTRRWFNDKGHVITTEDGRRAVISVMLDVNENVKLQERLQREVMEDSLTGILNRKGAITHIENHMRKKQPGSMFLLDIDNFKQLNDTYGHQVGDQVLIGLAKIMRNNCREKDVAARIGGDEFIMFLPGCTSEEVLKMRADRICSDFKRAGALYSRVDLSVSIGIAVSDGSSGFDLLFKIADDQLYQAKKSGKGKFQYRDIAGI